MIRAKETLCVCLIISALIILKLNHSRNNGVINKKIITAKTTTVYSEPISSIAGLFHVIEHKRNDTTISDKDHTNPESLDAVLLASVKNNPGFLSWNVEKFRQELLEGQSCGLKRINETSHGLSYYEYQLAHEESRRLLGKR